MKRNGWIVLLAVVVLAGAAVGGYLFMTRDRPAPAPAEESAEFIPPTPIPTPTPSPTPSPTPEPNPEPTPEPPTYEEVAYGQTLNDEILGILEWGADEWNYVLYREGDNDFYLTHDYVRSESVNGAVFLDAYCTLEPRDTVWILHGHNMRSGAIFGHLARYRERSFCQAHPYIVLTLLHDRQYYEPIAALDVDVDVNSSGFFALRQFNFDTDEAFDAYMTYMRSHAAYDVWRDVTREDDILILSTCSYVYSDSRFIVVCRRVPDPYAAPEDAE